MSQKTMQEHTDGSPKKEIYLTYYPVKSLAATYFTMMPENFHMLKEENGTKRTLTILPDIETIPGSYIHLTA